MQDSIQHLIHASDTLHVAISGASSIGGFWIQLLWSTIPALIVGGLSYLGMRHEIGQRQKEQEFAISKEILIKCLDAIQGAYFEVMKLKSIIGQENIENDQNKIQIIRDNLHNDLFKIKEWYNQHCVYLPKEIREQFLKPVFGSHYLVDEKFSNSDKNSITGKVIKDYITLLETIITTIDRFMSKYNLLETGKDFKE